MKRWVSAGFAGVLIVGASVGAVFALPKPPPPDVYVGLADAVVHTNSVDVKAFTLSFVNFRTAPLSFGVVNPATGLVEDGEFIGYIEVDLGNAPVTMQILYFDEHGIRSTGNLDASQSTFSAYFTLDGGLPGEIGPLLSRSAGNAMSLRSRATPAAVEGEYGEVSVKVALVSSLSDKIQRSLGTKHFIVYQLRSENDPGQLLGGSFMNIGGAR